MGRSKVLSTEEKTIKVITTESSYKFVISNVIGSDIGEYVKMDKRDKEIVLYFTKKIDKAMDIKGGPIVVSFD